MTEDNKRNAKQCIEVAETAYASGDLEKAKRFLQRAQRMHSTARAIQLLGEIGDETVRNPENPSRNSNRNNNTETPSVTDMNRSEAEKCIEIAEEAIAERDFGKAERFLLKAERMCSTDRAKELLDKISNEVVREASREYHHNAGNLKIKDPEAAETCILKAQTAFNNSDLDKAIRLLKKAERLCPSLRAKDLLRQVEAAKAIMGRTNGTGSAEASTSGTSGNQSNSSSRNSTNNAGASRNNSTASTSRQPLPEDQPRERRPAFTEEQMATIQRVTNANTDYDILGVPNPSTFAVVKKAHRRLTLLLHPDRNGAPGADRAYMKLNDAFDRLKSTLA